MLNSNQSAWFHFKSFLVFIWSGYYAYESDLTPPTLRTTEHVHITWRTATYIYTYIYIRTYLKSQLNTNMTELARFARSLISHKLTVIPRQSRGRIGNELCRAPNPHTRYSLSNVYHPGMHGFECVATRGNKKCGLYPYLIHTFWPIA